MTGEREPTAVTGALWCDDWPLRARIVAWLTEQFEPATSTQIAEGVGETHLPRVCDELRNAERRHQVMCVGDGHDERGFRRKLWVSR